MEGREDVNDDARPVRSSKSTTDENLEAVNKMILSEFVDKVGITFDSC